MEGWNTFGWLEFILRAGMLRDVVTTIYLLHEKFFVTFEKKST